MKTVPIVEQFGADPPASACLAVERLAADLGGERAELRPVDQFRELAVDHLDGGPSLHIDDLSEMLRPDCGEENRFYQDRARLRAGDDDLVASCAVPVEGYESYCQDYLGLGAPIWLRPQLPQTPLRIAEACWEDAIVRRTLIEELKRGDLRYVHPHMGTIGVWELAVLLHYETKLPIQVIAPPPGLTRWVNDKIAFTHTVSRLFGAEFVPRTESASNLAYLSKRVQELACDAEIIGFKLPSSGGGEGNLVVRADQFRGQSLADIREKLSTRLRALAWDGSGELLIDRWETEVVCSPSAQLWIPPDADGPPVVEGIFVQATEGTEREFVGSTRAQFPDILMQEIVDRCWLLGRLFQMLGYLGRCSFDMILVGDHLDDCRLEFVECNGRWGGTSLPMTMMNRIFGDWQQQPYAVQVAHHIQGLDQIGFLHLLDYFADETFDVRTGTGSLIFYNPGRLAAQCGISVLACADSWEQAASQAAQMPRRLRKLAEQAGRGQEANQ